MKLVKLVFNQHMKYYDKWKALENNLYLENNLISKMELFSKIGNNFQPLTIFSKSFIRDVSLGYEYASAYVYGFVLNVSTTLILTSIYLFKQTIDILEQVAKFV